MCTSVVLPLSAVEKTHLIAIIRTADGAFLHVGERTAARKPVGRTDKIAAVRDLLDKRLVIVTGKGGVGKSTVALALAPGRGRARQAHDRLRGLRPGAALARVPPRRGRLPRGRDGRQPLGDLDRPGRVDEGVRADPAQGEGDARPALPLADLHLPRRRDAGPARAGHDRQDLGAGPAQPQGPRAGASTTWSSSTRRPPGTASASCRRRAPSPSIARVGPIRSQAETLDAFITNHRKTGVAIVALPEEMPVNESASLEQALTEEVGASVDRVFMNGLYPERFDAEEAERSGADRGRAPEGAVRAACRAAVSQRRRAVRPARAARPAATSWSTAPFTPCRSSSSRSSGSSRSARLAAEVD